MPCFLMFSTGLRKAEVCSLKVKSISTYRNQPVVDVIGKGNKHRRVALNNDVAEAIVEYQKALKNGSEASPSSQPSPARGEGDSSTSPQNDSIERPLFFTLGNRGNCRVQPITHKAVDCLLRRVKRSALITKRITPHTTRHTFATTLLDKGVDKKIEAINRLQFI